MTHSLANAYNDVVIFRMYCYSLRCAEKRQTMPVVVEPVYVCNLCVCREHGQEWTMGSGGGLLMTSAPLSRNVFASSVRLVSMYGSRRDKVGPPGEPCIKLVITSASRMNYLRLVSILFYYLQKHKLLWNT